MAETVSKELDLKKMELTRELYNILIEEGYKYLMVREIVMEDDFKTYTFTALRELPEKKEDSCTGIADSTIKEIVYNKIPGVAAMIQVPIRRTGNMS